MEPTIFPVAGRHATRLGRESACRYASPGPIFLQAAEGQGAGACLDWYSGFPFSWEVTMTQDDVASFGLPRRKREILSAKGSRHLCAHAAFHMNMIVPAT
jgi:hypothetical protein